MIDQPTTVLPTEEEKELWQFDLAKRIVREGRDDRQSLVGQIEDEIKLQARGNSGD